MANKDDSDCTVGFKKPPRHAQFKPGQSGNKKGRPKGAKNFATIFAEELNALVIFRGENGKRKRISMRRAIVKQHINKAANGEPRAAALVLNAIRLYGDADKVNQLDQLLEEFRRLNDSGKDDC
jgi:hypothetical protein